MSGEQIPALEEVDGGLYDGADLIVYTADAEHAEYEPATEWGQDLGIVSFSLWARFDDHEIPIWSQAEEGHWLSLSPEVYGPDEPDTVSEAFVHAVADLLDDEGTEGWGNTTESTFEAMEPVEQLLWHRIRLALFQQRPPEALQVVRWCAEADGRDDGGEEDAE